MRYMLMAVVLTLPGAVLAQSYTTYDTAGRRTGTVVQQPGGDYAIRDTAGRTTGYVVQQPGGSYAIRDTAGRTTGYATGSRR